MPLTPRRFYQIVGACTLAGLLVGYLFAQQRQRHASDAAIARGDSLAQAIADSTAVYARRLHEDSLTVAQQADQLARAATLQHRATVVGVVAARLEDTIRIALPDTMLPMFERLGAAHREQIGLLVGALSTKDSVIGSLEQRVSWRDSVLNGVRSQLEAAMQQLRAALAAGRPKRCGVGAALGYSATSSGGAVRTGPGLTAGLSCRL